MFKKIKNIGILISLFSLISITAMGQDTGFLLSGYASTSFEADANENTFATGNFASTFIWSHSDRLLFEGELETGYAHGGFEIGLEYASLAYILNDYMTLRAGKFLSPFNSFNERMHPTWINKMPSNPLGMGGHDPVGPASEFGVELRGGARLGGPQINYSLFVSNGIALNVVEDVESPSATLNYTNAEDNNNSKAIGGRFGLLPFDDSSLEVGISGHYSDKTGSGDTAYEELSSFSWSSDIIWHLRGIQFIRGNIDLRGQINKLMLDRFNLQTENESIEVDFDQRAYYGQLAYRPVMSGSSLLSNTELIVRYSVYDLPAVSFEGDAHADEDEDEGDGHAHKIKSFSAVTAGSSPNLTGINQLEAAESIVTGHTDESPGLQTQWGFGINYWISWRTVFKIAYQIEELNGQQSDALFIQFATGL